MVRSILAFATFFMIPLLSGCLTTPGTATFEAPPIDLNALPRISLGGSTATGSDPMIWSGQVTGQSDQKPFELGLPEGFWTTHSGALEASIAWSHMEDMSFHLQLVDASGKVLADGKEGWFASVILLPSAPAGKYAAVVKAPQAGGAYEGVIQLEARDKAPGPVHDLLPDIVTLPPTRLQVIEPIFGGPAPAQHAAGIYGCGLDEVVEQQAKRCLRLDNRVGNIGEGALEVRLSLKDGATSPAGQSHWIQRVYRSDGTHRDEAVGAAVFHATHSHFHYKGLAHYQLYQYDLATHTRGASVNEGTKSGFCFIDIGLVKLGLAGTVYPRYGGGACANPFTEVFAPGADWFMGLSPGWFDLYYWGLPEQYVEITGVADGIYELVSTANSDATLIETDHADNEASVVFKLMGDQAQILESHEMVP